MLKYFLLALSDSSLASLPMHGSNVLLLELGARQVVGDAHEAAEIVHAETCQDCELHR